MNTVVLIMAGGGGTRLWPLSTDKTPKQFLTLEGVADDDSSLLQQTFNRAKEITSIDKIFVVTNKQYGKQTIKQLSTLGFMHNNLIEEPKKNNTALAIYYSNLFIQQRLGNNFIEVVMPADHVIGKDGAFYSAVANTVSFAEQASDIEDEAYFYTFGITPTYPATCYGYIQPEEHHPLDFKTEAQRLQHPIRVEKFVEKPNYTTAKQYINNGFLWNSGIFVWHNKHIQDEIETFLPKYKEMFDNIMDAFGKEDWDEKLSAAYTLLESKSIDYAVLEKSQAVKVSKADFEWDDLGNWDALEKYAKEATNNNRQNINSVYIDATNNFIYNNETDKVVSIIGLDNIFVINANGHIIISSREKSGSIKDVKDKIKHINYNPFQSFSADPSTDADNKMGFDYPDLKEFDGEPTVHKEEK